MSKFHASLKERVTRCGSNVHQFALKTGLTRNAIDYWKDNPGSARISSIITATETLVDMEKEAGISTDFSSSIGQFVTLINEDIKQCQ
jgi:hypothetical protein